MGTGSGASGERRLGATIDFRALFEAVPGLYLILRPDFTIAAVSNAYLAATMTRRDDIVGRGIFDVFPDNPDDPDATGVSNLRSSLMRVLELRKPDTMAVQKYDVRRPASEGGGFEERYWSPVNSPVLDAEGNVALIIHRVEDVTEFVRLKLQDSRKEQETRELRGQAERMEAEIYRRAQELQQSNKALRESEERLQKLNATLEERVQERGRQLEAEVRERERAQEALRERQKVEAIGRLTGSIAHDFNNLLTVVLGNGELLRGHVAEGPGAAMVNAIERASERGARLVRQLLAFTRRQALRPETIDVAQHIRSLDDFLAGSLGGNIKLVMALPEDLWPVECDVGEFELALINLCVNARDAMPGGGLLRIEGRNAALRRGELAGADLEGPLVAISVSDTGSGIAPDVLKRVFEPLFTTKDIGKGSGLGLTQVQGFATQSGGLATIESEIGRGTTVTIYLPQARAAARGEEPPRMAAMPRGTGEVLLVEDDEGVAKIGTQLLEMIGYRAHWVPDAQTALALLIGGRPFDLVFSDIVMPGAMSGLELARRVRRHFPRLPVLLASGFSTAAAEVAKEGFPIIAKPYRAETLAGAVEQALRDARGEQQRSA
jgi:signal transduction histidine kinase/ActR/RegA family two-component response regulator